VYNKYKGQEKRVKRSGYIQNNYDIKCINQEIDVVFKKKHNLTTNLLWMVFWATTCTFAVDVIFACTLFNYIMCILQAAISAFELIYVLYATRLDRPATAPVTATATADGTGGGGGGGGVEAFPDRTD